MAQSNIFSIAEDYVKACFELDPILATEYGRTKTAGKLPSLTYSANSPGIRLARQTRAELRREKALTPEDRRTKKLLDRFLTSMLVANEALWHYTEMPSHHIHWNFVESLPLKIFTSLEDYNAATTVKEKRDFLSRMEAIPTAYAEWISGLEAVAALGHRNNLNNVLEVANLLEKHSKGEYLRITKKRLGRLSSRATEIALAAEAASASTAAYLRTVYAPQAPTEWRLGRKRYIQFAEVHCGTSINPKTLYKSGLMELDQINAHMWRVGKEILPTAKSLREIADYLNTHPDYQYDRKEFVRMLRATTKFAFKKLNGTVFDIPKKLLDIQVRLDDTSLDASPYYTSPSADFRVPATAGYPTLGRDTFSFWYDTSTWFHETIPGHHLQVGMAVINKKKCSAFQRDIGSFVNAYNEGWALYAERLMDELGYFDTPEKEFGYLLNQALRAARLIIDIGLHLSYEKPEGGIWQPEDAVELLENRVLLDHEYAVSEVKRYMAWGGQAISYKVGERVWLQIRRDARKRLGEEFDIRKFHTYALSMGVMTLDMLQEEMAKWDGR